MAVKKMSLKQWVKACVQHTHDDGFLDLTGPTQTAAAQTLEVSRQRVGQLIEDGTFDAVQITGPLGKVSVTYVTQNSLNRYLAARRPYAVDGRFTLAS
jgi:hypothetical protein